MRDSGVQSNVCMRQHRLCLRWLLSSFYGLQKLLPCVLVIRNNGTSQKFCIHWSKDFIRAALTFRTYHVIMVGEDEKDDDAAANVDDESKT